MTLRSSHPPGPLFLRLIQQRHFIAANTSWRWISCRLLSLLLTYALLLQLVPHVAIGAPAKFVKSPLAKRSAETGEKSNTDFSWVSLEAGAGAWSEAASAISGGTNVLPATITDAVVSRHKPTLNSGRIEGTLRVMQGESFTINGSTHLTSDLYLPGTPIIQLSGGAQYAGTISDGGAANPANYTVSLTGGINLPGEIHTNVDAIQLPADFPNSVPSPTGTRNVTINSQSDVAGIGNWQTVRDLNVTGSHLLLDVPPGNYRTFTVNGNSQLNFTAGTYNFSNTIILDGSAKLRATGLVTINVAQNLTVNSGALVLGSYTSPGDVHLNVLGSFVTVNGSSQVSGLIRAYNGTVTLKGSSQIRGQVIANSLTLSGGKIIGAVWPLQSGNSLTVFGPRRFDRTTGPPNQYLEQFALPAGVTSPYTLHMQNGEPEGSNRISSATIKLNGVDLLTPNDLNQNIAGVDRTIVLMANNQLDVRLQSAPGSYLIMNIAGILPGGDTAAPAIAITSPADHSTTTATQTNVNGTASDLGAGASGVAHVYVNNSEAAYNSSDGTWTISNVALALGANQLSARAIDQAGNEAIASITVTRESPTNQAPTVGAGLDQTLTLPQTALLQGTATDDGLPENSSLTTIWTRASGPGTVTFVNNGTLNTTASFSAAGTYVLRLTASDGTLSTSDDLTITMQPQNQPPTVNGGPDQTLALPHTATLNGTVTDDGLPAGGTLTITWTQVNGPGAVTFEDASLAETTASFSISGTYVLRLTAGDTELTSQSDVTITVQPENRAPIVNAGSDQIVSLPAAAQLNGAAADDAWPAGSILSLSWSFISGPGSVSFDNPNSPSTIARLVVAGTYVLRLTASDGELSSTDEVSITVIPPNQAPSANAGLDQAITLPNNTADLNGTISDDGLPLGSSVLTNWSKVSGPGAVVFANPNVTVTTATFSEAGTYVLRLTAGDSQLAASDETTITVLPENHAPAVDAGTDQAVNLPNAASLNGSSSDDGLPAGSTLTTTWSKLSGPGDVTFSTQTEELTSATFSIAGAYVLRLTASDSQLTSSDEVLVTVIPENHAPTANAGPGQTITLPNSAKLNGTVSDDGLPAGSSLTSTWSKVSGPGTVTFANANVTVTTAAFSQSGIYFLRLTATDSQLSASADVQINVIAENLAPTANAGPDQTIMVPASANLNGSVSDDGLPTGSTITTAWSKVSGPGTVTFANPAITVTTASFSEPGTYVLGLAASDSALATNDDVTITVIDPRVPPVASFVVPESTGTAGASAIAASGSAGNIPLADNLLDDNNATVWNPQATTNQFAKYQFYDQQNVFIDRVRLQSNQGGISPTNLKDFDVQISSTTTDDASFVTVLSATMLNNGQLQEFVFPGGSIRAHYLKLLLKNNYGSTFSVSLATFNPVAIGSVDSLLSLPGLANVARGQSPALVINGAAIYSSSYGGGANSADGLLGYNRGGFITSSLANEFAIIRLGGGKVYNLKGVRVATWFDSGFASANPTAVKDFEVWVSATTPDPASFTKVLSATAAFVGNVQTFIFPGGSVPARYVKYVPLNNQGTGTVINTAAFDVIVETGARVMSSSGELGNTPSPPEAAFDGDSTTIWNSPANVATNVSIKTALMDDKTQKVYGFRISGVNNGGLRGPKDIEILVSTTTTDDSAFTTVYTGTLAATFGPQEILLSNPVDAKYVQFFWKNGYSGQIISVYELEVLAAPDRGSSVVAFSSGAGNVEAALDLDPTNLPWLTPTNQNSSVAFKLLLPRAELATLSHIALRPALSPTGYTAPKDFQLQVSTTDAADSSFSTVLAGTLVSSAQMQDFYFAPVQARYVRLLLIKGPNDFRSFALHNFLIYSSDTIGATTRFIDRSSDADGQIISWAWNFGDGSTSTQRHPVHTFAATGDYTVTLTVADNSELTNTFSTIYHVVGTLNPDFAMSPLIAHEGGESVRFADLGELLLIPSALRTYDFGDGSSLFTQYARTSQHTFPDSGMFHVTLKVGDSLGVSHTVTRDITVLNLPPSVDIDPGKTLVWGEPWTSVPRITDQSSIDRLSLQGQWIFGDGLTQPCVNCTNANATVTHAYSHPGTYSAALTVTDKDGGVESDQADFIVNKRPTAFIFQTPPSQSTGQPLVIHAQLVDTFANQPLSVKPVQFTLNGASFNAVTGANGVAEVSVPLPTGTKIDIITGTFAEDEYYFSCGGVAVPVTAGGTPPSGSLSNRGTNFWLMFPQAYSDGFGLAIQKLFITSTVDTSGNVSIPGAGFNFTQNFTVPANTVATVQMPSVQVAESNIIQAKGIHITAQQSVTVYGLNQRANSSDGLLALPVNSLGTDHFILTYSNMNFAPSSELGVVATENGTTVTITPSVTTGARLGGVPYNLTLNQGQTYLLQNTIPDTTGDLTGSRVTSDKPIAVFGGHVAATINAEAACCADHLVEQLPPTKAWGKRFATVPLATRTKGDFFRFIAAQDGASIYLNGNLTAVLNRGQWVERVIKNPTEIIATAPIMVAQYSTSSNYDPPTTGKADPFMMIIPPYSQFLNHYTISTPLTGFAINYANVVAPTASLGSITLDGAPMPAGSFTPIGVSGFSGAQIAITVGLHNFDGPASFGIFIYGYAPDEGYGYPAGMNIMATVQSTNVTIRPETSSHSIDTSGCVVASVVNQDLYPLGGKTLSFTVTGANPSSSSATTDAAGQATLCYAGANVGTDQVAAAVGTSQGTATIVWTPPNQAPLVNAGADQTITLPAAANLQGSVTDDGLPVNTLSVSWSKVSGPGNVTFGNVGAANTTATFAAPGVYVLSLTVNDTALSNSVNVQIIVNPAPVNQPPTANAGPDQSATVNGNLIANGGNEDQLVGGEIPGWVEVQGTTWVAGSANIASGFPNAQRNSFYFFASDAPQAELRQDVDVSVFAAAIAAGTQQFEFKAYVRSASEAAPDSARVVVEYRNANNSSVIATLDSGEITSTNAWHLTDDMRTVPLGTGWIRVRLIGTRTSGATNDAFFDSITLRPIGNAAVKLNGTTTDDGLPAGSSVSANWATVSGPGVVSFTNTNSAGSAAHFVTPGTYVLRLTAGDGQLSSSDDVNIKVAPANQPPVVSAGANQTITLPAIASLSGTVNDDGLPAGSSVSVVWSQVSGSGTITFANANQTVTTASFSAAGSYVLRLTADDTEYDASADVTITVNPEPIQVNQPPVVNPGPNQTIALPANTVTLNGVVADDGLPVGSTLTVTWTRISGPGSITFGDANSAVTTAQLSAVGSYVLRLSASDGAYLVSADVGVILAPQNYPPTANAGPNQTTLLSQPLQLDGSAGDDGLPAGSNLTMTWSAISGPAAVTFDNPNVTITGVHFTATGTYVLRLTANDGALTASDELAVTVIDNVPPPTVEIIAPTAGSSVTEPSIVTGSVSGGSWVLEYSPASDDTANNHTWTRFAGGNGPTLNGALGTVDPTMMLNGLFDIRLSATDSYGQTSRTTQAVIVEQNLKVGNFTVSFSDLNIPLAGVPLEVTRTYDSRDKRVGDFGFGWTLGVKNIRVEKARVIGLKWFETKTDEAFPNYCLEASAPHLVTVTFPGGKVFKFEASTSPRCQRFAPISGGTLTFTPLPGTHGTLEIVGLAEFQVEGSVPGPVNLIGFGGGVDIFNSSLFKFTAEDGTAFVIDQRAGLQSIQDTNNNTVTLSAGGILHSGGKSISFNRDALGRITSVTDPAGNAQTYAYDAAGDLVSYTDNENNTSAYSYDASHRLLTIHDPRGIQPIRNDYDAGGRLISHTDGFGKVITYTHDLPGRTETITDRLGHSTIFQYDERGNVLTNTDARGGVTTFTYDANDNVLTETNALGKTTTYTYDANDHRTSITDSLSNLTQFTYNGLGKVLTTTDPLLHVTTNTYNGSGNLLTTRDALNNTTTFAYSPFDGQRILTTDALNNSTHYDYTNGYLTKETDALGHETTFSYDANGNRASQTVKRTNAQGQLEAITTSYEYDKLNRLKKTTFADGSFTQVEYNSIGQQSATIDQLGHRTEFSYDDMGRLTLTEYPDNTHDKTTYDAEGRRLSSKDRAGHVTSYTYDELGRLTKTTFADGTFMSTTYDAAGQVLAMTDARGNVTYYEYDNAGRRTKVRNALNQETTFAYDAGGNQLSMSDALSHTTTYEYDLNNRRTKTTYADSSFDTVSYDALGRSVSKTDQAGKTTQFTYDALGRLTRVKDALHQETVYAYNEIGQQVSQTDANNHTTRFEYDQLGRRVKRILPAGQLETYSYDNAGNLQTRTDFNGRTTRFNYDLMRRLLSKIPDASLNQPTISFTYNTSGQRATMSDASGTTVYSYDARNRLSSKQTPFGTLSYTYNDSGRLLTTRSSNANGVSVDYSYDSLNRLASVKDKNLIALNGGVTTYSYDNVGNLQGYSYPNGVNSSYAYNSLNRLTTMTVGTTGSSLAIYSYTLGPAGNRTAVTELSGRTVNYTYDDLYRLTGEAIANDPHGVNGSVSYGYDSVGNRLNRPSSIAGVPSQTSTYDANDRLTRDSYDDNGNTTSANGNSYAYDFENHLTSLNGGNVTYVYDGDGNRVAKTVAGVTTNYLVDTNNPTGYAQVVEELQSGTVVKSFTYGHDLISQRIVGGSLSFYGYDGHGSVRFLTDATAAITDTYDYDAFGNLISRTGTTSNDYLYSGEQFDANLGFYYLRARYMNPTSGRFWSMDSYEGGSYDPGSLHKYSYTRNSPANLIDPSGHFSLVDTLNTSVLVGTISGFTIGLLTGGLQGAVRGAVQGALIGALIPLTGAGVGYALLGNAARGVFIVGWGVGLGNAGVSGLSFATATTGEERFDAGVGFVATVGFMFIGPRALQYANTRTIAAEELNAEFLSLRSGRGQPPWPAETQVTEITIFRSLKYVRVYTEGQTKPVGAWVMEASEIEGLSMSQIQQKFALPFTPTNITTVEVPAGSTIRIGLAGQNSFGPGGGMQVNIVE